MQSANELLLQHSKFAPKPPRSSSPLPLPLLFPQNESRKRKTQNVKIITPPSFPRKKSYLRTPPLNPNPQNRRTFHLRLSGRHPTCDDQVISNHSFQFPTTRFSFSSQIQKFKKKQPSQTLTPVLHLGLRSFLTKTQHSPKSNKRTITPPLTNNTIRNQLHRKQLLLFTLHQTRVAEEGRRDVVVVVGVGR